MRRKILKSLAVLLAVFLSGAVWVSCENPTVADGGGGGSGGSTLNFEKVKAANLDELTNYLLSSSSSFEITLDFERKDIYLQKNLTITQPMKIIGSSTNPYTIHSVDRDKGKSFFCLDLKADLTLEYCVFTGYDKTSSAAGGIGAGYPSLLIGEKQTLTIGKGSALVLNPSSSGTSSADFTGGTIQIEDGGSLRNETNTDIVFASGITNVNVKSGGSAVLLKNGLSIGGINPTFEVNSGSFGINRNGKKYTYAPDGNVSLKKDWNLQGAETLHVKSGELTVKSGVKINVAADFDAVILDGNVRLDDGSALWVDTDPFPVGASSKIKGEGCIIIEHSTGTRPDLRVKDLKHGILVPFSVLSLANGRAEIGSRGYKLTTVNTNLPATFKLASYHAIAAGLDFLVEPDVTLNILPPEGVFVLDRPGNLISFGGSLTVRGAVNISGDGAGFVNVANLETAGTPTGTINIEDGGRITVDKMGCFVDEPVSFNPLKFYFPAYGGGSLVIKNSEGDSGVAKMGGTVGGTGGTYQLTLEKGASFTITGSSAEPSYTLMTSLTGEAASLAATLTLKEDTSLAGPLTLLAGTKLDVVDPYVLTGTKPNLLAGPSSINGIVSPVVETKYGATVKLFEGNTTVIDEINGLETWDGKLWK